jgi:hypothetical protein
MEENIDTLRKKIDIESERTRMETKKRQQERIIELKNEQQAKKMSDLSSSSKKN